MTQKQIFFSVYNRKKCIKEKIITDMHGITSLTTFEVIRNQFQCYLNQLLSHTGVRMEKVELRKNKKKRWSIRQAGLVVTHIKGLMNGHAQSGQFLSFHKLRC